MARRSITVEEAAAQIPGATVVTLPDAWFADLPPGQSVFVSLLERLKAVHGATEPRRDLHNRTYAGKDMMKRLEAAETKRIRQRHKLSGEKLKQAAAWSNLDSGPKETFDSQALEGDALFFVPPDADG